jgi:uncharacterized membrane protein
VRADLVHARRDDTERWVLGDDPRRGALCLAITGALIAAYVVYFTHVTEDTYRHYGVGTFDLGFYDQGLWLLSRFRAPYVTLMGRNLFGDHAQFSLLAIVPLYWIRPAASTLLGVQALAMASGAIPVYLLAMRRLRNPVLATVFAATFLLHPALGRTNLENYHPDSFLIPVLGFAIYAAVENRARLFVVCSMLALLCKEDVVLILLPLALWYAWRHNRRVGAFVAGASVVGALFAMNVIMKSLVGVSTRNAYRLPFSACGRACSVTRHVSDFLKEFVTRPAHVVRYLLAGDQPNGRPFYVWQMLAPTGLVFLVAPELVLTTALVFAANVFSTVGFQHQIAYHYSMVLLPAISMGTIYAVSRLRSERQRAIAVAIVGVSTLLSAFLWGPLPLSRRGLPPNARLSASAVAAVERVTAQLPPHAVVAVSDRFVTHVDHREQVYLWPTPFFAQHWKLSAQAGQRLPQADDVEYLLLPSRLDDHVEVFDNIKAGFREVARAENDQHDGAVLYRRVAPTTLGA